MWACQTTKGGVCPFLYTLIIKYASYDIFMLRKRRFLSVLFTFLVMNV